MHAGRQIPASQAEVLRALETLQQTLRAGGAGQPALRFNALLQQACEHFPGADTLRLIQPLSPDMSVAVIEVRLAMMKRTLEREMTGAASPRPAGAERRPSERRRWQRRPVTWTAWLVLGQGDALAATAMDAGRPAAPALALVPGRSLTVAGLSATVLRSFAKRSAHADPSHHDRHRAGRAASVRAAAAPGSRSR